jgi:hypothetical protein
MKIYPTKWDHVTLLLYVHWINICFICNSLPLRGPLIGTIKLLLLLIVLGLRHVRILLTNRYIKGPRRGRELHIKQILIQCTYNNSDVTWTPGTVPRCLSDVTMWSGPNTRAAILTNKYFQNWNNKIIIIINCPGPKTRANSFDK